MRSPSVLGTLTRSEISFESSLNLGILSRMTERKWSNFHCQISFVGGLLHSSEIRGLRSDIIAPESFRHGNCVRTVLPDVFVDVWQMFLGKCQKSPFFDVKCTNLVTLAESGFQRYQITALPDMNIFCQILVIFGFFEKFLKQMCHFCLVIL